VIGFVIDAKIKTTIKETSAKNVIKYIRLMISSFIEESKFKISIKSSFKIRKK